MSLYRQMWLTVVVCLALAFAASLFAGLLGARTYITQQLEAKDADSAAALALSMSQLAKDRATLEVQAASLFEEGRYEAIRVRDREGHVLVEMRDAHAADRPLLAVLLPIDARAGSGEIADGPVRFGSVELVSVRDTAYAQLHATAMRMFAGFLGAAVLAGLLSGLVLRRLRAPLREVVGQAQAIAERRFVMIAPPQVPELASVVRAMNDMVLRVRAMFEEESVRLAALRHAAHHDALTGLPNREHFLNRLASTLDAEHGTGPGLLLLVRVRDLAGLNRRVGRELADSVLVRLAAILHAAAGSGSDGGSENGTHGRPGSSADAIAGRLNGADLALVLPDGEDAAQRARGAYDALRAAASALTGDDNAIIAAAGGYVPGEAVPQLLLRADEALARAELNPDEGIVHVDSPSAVHADSDHAWQTRLDAALREQRLRLVSYPVRRTSGALLHRECFARLEDGQGGGWLPAARFMPQVARLQLSVQFDMAMAQQVLDAIRASGEPRALNLSSDSLRDPHFVPALTALLDRAPDLLPNLWMELPDDAFHRFDTLALLVASLRKRGCKAGLERFGRDFRHVARLQELQLDYVKIDPGFTRGIAHSEGNRRFVAAACALLKGLGCLVVADGVHDVDDRDALAALGVDAVGGPAVREQE